MNELHLNLENCYGIRKLETSFCFAQTSTQLIYAPNGTMKTSLAKTFDDFSKQEKSKDLIHTARQTERHIVDEEGNKITPESIFVVKPYDQDFSSDKVALLLANEKLRTEYEEVHHNIEGHKEILLKKLAEYSGIKVENIEGEISSMFSGEEMDIYTSLKELEEQVINDEELDLVEIKYSSTFDAAVVAFLESADVKNQISEYILRYDELVSSSRFLQKDFNHYNANAVMRNLKSNRFFAANHSINLNDDGNIIPVEDDKVFNELIQEEMNAILEDPDLKSIFNSIDKKISNQKLRNFREFLIEHQEILPELSNLLRLKLKLWVAYLQASKEQMQRLLEVYKTTQEDINRIIADAESETTKWEEVLAIFHARFHVPFRIRIENKADSVLSRDVPMFFYDFEVCEARVEQDLLLRVLSRGEERALYLLNIIFEIQSRKATGQDTLLIIDDIADSFDYQNKYAIVEYLKELAEDSSFKMIIMTHNFDFFRTAQSRVCRNLAWKGSYMAQRTNGQIDFMSVKGNEVNTPFELWKEDLADPIKLLALIPFARNIAEYIGDKSSCSKLTAFLHIKQETYNLSICDLEALYEDLFRDIKKAGLMLIRKLLSYSLSKQIF